MLLQDHVDQWPWRRINTHTHQQAFAVGHTAPAHLRNPGFAAAGCFAAQSCGMTTLWMDGVETVVDTNEGQSIGVRRAAPRSPRGK